MNLSDLMGEDGIDARRAKEALVMRHHPTEPELRKVLPWLAAENHDLFNAYQQAQNKQAERAMAQSKYLASFIGEEPGKALFVGIYRIAGYRSLSYDEYWRKRVNRALHELGMKGMRRSRRSCLWFDLQLTNVCAHWKGKLVVGWSPGRTWYRWAHRNEFPVQAILEESALARNERPDSEKLVLTWDELSRLPKSLRASLSEWRGIYLIFDQSKQKGYVGAAYGKDNLYQRWTNYAKTGHGGNKQLRKCRARDLRFSILQLLAQNAEPTEVERLESTWKQRLHTREFGLNSN